MDEVEDGEAGVDIQFRFTQKSGKTVCRLNDISKSYGNNVIIEHANGEILNGDKIALIGANGLGKSTLLRIIAGTENSEGEVTTGHNVLPSFFAQHQLHTL
ncbi:MAG TPA: ATP-binding cassette domain-containing protein [Chitinophagaceae bacterium]|nr:ATP-binding cassette domain-containing protein [Chitinophagaceae bacterium]